MEKQPSSRSCFVCGRENSGGLRARWETDRAAGEVRSTVSVPEHFNGYPGVVHGGILAALLDEAMIRTALLEGGFENLLVTVRMEVTFRRTTPTCTPLTVVGRPVQGGGGRARAEAEVRLADGTVTAKAEAILAKPTAEVAAGWEAERPYWRVDGD